VDGEKVLDHLRGDTDPPVVFENPYKAYHADDDDEIARMQLLLGLHRAVTEGGEPEYGAANARADLEILYAMRESARRGSAWVELPLTEPTELEKQVEAERMNFSVEEAEEIHGPLFSMPKPAVEQTKPTLKHEPMPMPQPTDPKAAKKPGKKPGEKPGTVRLTGLAGLADFVREAAPEIAANAMICAIHQAAYLLKRQIESQGRAFLQQGGFTENLYKHRRMWDWNSLQMDKFHGQHQAKHLEHLRHKPFFLPL